MFKIDLENNNYLYYDRGTFDNWCCYEVKNNQTKTAPRDIEYFEEIKKYTEIFEAEKIYDDFVKIYDITTKEASDEVVKVIKEISLDYKEYQKEFFRLFSILYMGMVAEENKEHTKLGKRIKRLGMYNLLIKNYPPDYCANSTRGKTYKTIDKWCLEGNF